MKRVCFFKSSFVIRALLVSFSILPFWNLLYSQSEGFSLKTEIYQLKNGLTIYLNEDSALPNIFGAVVVKGGSKRDPADATGIAHYFEHIMFKGTDKIGTLDYVKEKIYLDSIAELYDKLSSVTAAEDKNMIQKKINRLSIKSSEYAIPNETEKILGEMGCAYLNAGTSYDGIAYFNVLPSSQLQKWMMVYSHRFINPVYRLFQSELEAVYEEYNMYSDNRFATALEEYLSHFFPDHPYGVPIIGYPKDLKYPSMSKMHEYFETYYVANNMALILSGNFNIDEVKPMIEKYFGQWRSGKIPEAPDTWKIEPFKGRVEVNKKLTPVKFGLRGYRSVPQNHPDSPLLDVIGMLLTNSAQTGLMDQLVIDNKLMAAQLIGDHRADAGGEYILYIPKLIGQSLKKAENLIEEKLNKLKSGEFDNDLLEAVKMEIIMGHKQNFEDQFNRGYMMIFSFMNEKEWQDILDYPETIKKVTKKDIVTIAKKYFGDNYLSFHSGSGLPKKPETIKPPFENIPAKNTEEKSEFAKMIAETKVASSPPQFIEFGPPGQKTKDVLIDNITDLAHLYWVNNSVNDVFNLKINYGIGTYKMPILEPASEYISLVAPFIGGILTSHFGWPSIFFVAGFIGIITTIGTFIFIKDERKEVVKSRFDYLGSILYGIGLFCLLYGFSLLPKTTGIILTILGIIFLIAFTKYQSRIDSPVFNIKLFFENKVFRLSTLSALINYSATFAIAFMFSLYLQYVRGLDPKEAGLVLIVQSIIQSVTSLVSGRLSDRISASLLATIGMAIVALGLLLLVFITGTTSFYFLVFILALLGLGFGFFSSPNVNVIMSSVEQKFYSMASATTGTMRLTGQAFSMGIAMMAISLVIGNVKLSPDLSLELLKSMKITFAICTLLCFAGVYTSSVRLKPIK
jgi:predicted Zn-dependent peptidase/MFS family permease